MTDISIKVDNLSKRYRIGLEKEKEDTIVGVIGSLIKSPLKNLRSLNNLTSFNSNQDSTDVVWALSDLSFEVEKGKVLGIIGPNGSGKSTLLKILAGITHPTSGRIELNGRVASLLEVGTGFHPELTGRENIYLNGTILGMTRKEIDSKLDEIVQFSGVENFLDTPVKRYSSGMRIRLAFSVAAHLDPEILLIDEVLAVGDAEFQNKCLGKMDEVAKTGRTVLFVSHNMGLINNICENGLLLEYGMKKAFGKVESITNEYLAPIINMETKVTYDTDINKKAQIIEVRIKNDKNQSTTTLDRMDSFSISVKYNINVKRINCFLSVMLDKLDNTAVCHSRDTDIIPENAYFRDIGAYCTEMIVPGGLLNAGHYKLRVEIAEYNGQSFDHLSPFTFQLVDLGTFASGSQYGRQRPGVLAPSLNWKTTREEK